MTMQCSEKRAKKGNTHTNVYKNHLHTNLRAQIPKQRYFAETSRPLHTDPVSHGSISAFRCKKYLILH